MFRFDVDEDSRAVAELAREFGRSVREFERAADESGTVPPKIRQQAEEAGLLDLGRAVDAGGLGLPPFADGHATAALVEIAPSIGTALLWPEAAGLFGAPRGVRLADGGGGALGYARPAELEAAGGRVQGRVAVAVAGDLGHLAVARAGGSDRLYRTAGGAVERVAAMGQRALGLCSLTLDAEAEEVGPFGAGERARLWLWQAPFFHGYGRAALAYARDYAAGRRAFGHAIGSFQGVAFLLADVAMEVEAAELLWLEAAVGEHDGARGFLLAAHALAAARDAAYFAVNSCVGILGGHGFVDDHPAERWLRDVETLSQIAGSLAALRGVGAVESSGREVEEIA